MPMITRTFSATNFIIASSALVFQVFVLYPWHKELDDAFKELKREHLEILLKGERERAQELRNIREQIAELKLKDQTKSARWL